jgi:hypothetical protein
MYPFLFALALSFFPGSSKGQIQVDKLEHFVAGALVSGTTQLLVYHFTDNRCQSMLIGFGAGLFAGIAKEFYDLKGHGYFSYKDLFWTALGSGATTISLHYTIHAKPRAVSSL